MKNLKSKGAVAVWLLIIVTILFGCGSNNVVLTMIAVTPNNPTILHGTTGQFFATGTYSDDSTADLTSSATWTMSDTTIATVSNTAGSQGLVTALTVGGPVTITATDPSTNIAGSTTLTVN